MMVTSWIIVISSTGKHIKIKERTTSKAMVFYIGITKERESEYTWRSVDRPL